MKAFEEATGIDVNYIGSKEFEGSISIRVDAGDAPDIADFPQPGLLASFVSQGKIVDPTTFISEDWLKQQYNQSWLDMAQIGGQTAGVWHRFNGKSLVWYPKDDFDAAGYTVPTTWDELIALSDQIKADGDAPWCVGIESGAATGWPATDWMEEIMLRTTSLENYDKWVTGELKFSSPEVKNAAETLGALWFTDGYVYGGRPSIVSTFFGDAPAPMFEQPPKCWLHKQGNFITGFFPPEAKAGVDYGFFYLPPIDDAVWEAVPGGWGHHGDVQRPAGSAGFDGVLHHAAVGFWLAGDGWGVGGAQDRHTGDVRCGPGARHCRAGVASHQLPLRRFGPDAGCGRRRIVLERHDRLGVGRSRSGHRPGRDRRLLAGRC